MVKIFIDFDGTITKLDVGDAMFEAFGGEQCLDFIREYHDEQISAVECFRKECLACAGVDKKELDDFIDKQNIDQAFDDFVSFCNKERLQYYIVSDGMDYYIQRILERYKLNNVPSFSNHLDLTFLDGTSKVFLNPSFPYTDEACDRCACCKRNHLLTICGDDDIIIYIGEGYSDRCPARFADIVFAKDDLLKYCRQENISYFEYCTFADIVERLIVMLSKPHSKKYSLLRKRRQAQLAAREVFLGG